MRNLFLNVQYPYSTLKERCDIIASHLFAAVSDPFNSRRYMSMARADIMSIVPDWLEFRPDGRRFAADLWALVDRPTREELMDGEEIARQLVVEHYASELSAEQANDSRRGTISA